MTLEDPILFPEERVLVLLEEYDGRMWQQDVVAETGFSAGKVSRLLTEMEADEHIARYWKNGRKAVAYPDIGPDTINP